MGSSQVVAEHAVQPFLELHPAAEASPIHPSCEQFFPLYSFFSERLVLIIPALTDLSADTLPQRQSVTQTHTRLWVLLTQ